MENILLINDVLHSQHCLFPTEFHHPTDCSFSGTHNIDLLKFAQFWKNSAWIKLFRNKLWLLRAEKIKLKVKS